MYEKIFYAHVKVTSSSFSFFFFPTPFSSYFLLPPLLLLLPSPPSFSFSSPLFFLLFHLSSPTFSSFFNHLLSPHTYTHIFFLTLPPSSLLVLIPFHFPVNGLPF
jgi:hypothetical protein